MKAILYQAAEFRGDAAGGGESVSTNHGVSRTTWDQRDWDAQLRGAHLHHLQGEA